MPEARAVPEPVKSPCVGVCRLDAQSMCIGCGRLLGEIAEWSRASHARQHEICEAARKRLPHPPAATQSAP